LADPGEVICFGMTSDGAADAVRGNRHPNLRDWKKGTDLGTLFAAGVLDRSGRLLPDRSAAVREGMGGPEFVLVPEGESGSGEDIILTQADLENLLRAKAAVFAGAKILLESTGHGFGDIQQLWIAGGFGSYMNVENAVLLGMIPDLPRERVRFVGNTAVRGAKQALLSSEALARSREIATSVTYYDLITYPGYYDEFMSAKFLPHTEGELFPTVNRAEVQPLTGRGGAR
jgi:uncharacterized 2Fe-2S/4Fe-4S cluster protein (DUF4445 family)